MMPNIIWLIIFGEFNKIWDIENFVLVKNIDKYC